MTMQNQIGIPKTAGSFVVCQIPNSHKTYRLTIEQLQLMVLISYHGALTYAQMNRLFALLHNNPDMQISNATLKRWCINTNGLLGKKIIQHHAMYHLNKWFIEWMHQYHILNLDDISLRKSNLHNLLLNETLINGLYYTYLNVLQDKYYHRINQQLDNGFALLAYLRNRNNKHGNQIIEYSSIQAKKSVINRFKELQKIMHQNVPQWLYGLDMRSYNRQLNITWNKAQQLILKPDAVFRFNHHTIFFELDNRTENNYTLIDKMKNYLYHASKHPKENFNICFVFNDGSLRNQKVTHFRYPVRKISFLAQAMFIQKMHFKHQEVSLIQAYREVPNCNFFLAPLKTSWIDINDIMQVDSLNNLVMNTLRYWQKKYAHTKGGISIAFDKQKTQNVKYMRNTFSGNLISNQDASVSPKIRFIFAQEHLIDTLISQWIAQYVFENQHTPVILVYPYRNQIITPNLISIIIHKKLANQRQFAFDGFAILKLDSDYHTSYPSVKLPCSIKPAEQKTVPFDYHKFKH